MSIQTSLFTALGPIVGNRVYPNKFPLEVERPKWPAIRYVVITRVTAPDICGDGDDAAPDDAADERFQLDVAALDYATGWTVRSQVRTAMKAAFGESSDAPALLESEGEEFDQETKTHRFRMDYVFSKSSGSGA